MIRRCSPHVARASLLALLLTTLVSLPMAQVPMGERSPAAEPEGTAFTFQRQVADPMLFLDGVYDFEFRLLDDPDPQLGWQVGTLLQIDQLTLQQGCLDVALDFGDDPDVFNGQPRWLQIGWRYSNTLGAYRPLERLQQITVVPYALHARTASSVSHGIVPVGTVIDWWRPDSTFPVPDGYAICDGSWINDPESPLDGVRLPSLQDKFIRGTTDPFQIGIIGGSDDHGHTVDVDHDHSQATTDSAGAHDHVASESGAHAHAVDLPDHEGWTNWAGAHQHKWAMYQAFQRAWYSYTPDSTGLQLIADYNGGIGSEGSGLYPLMYTEFTSPFPGYDEKYLLTEDTGSHRHSLDHDHAPVDSSVAGLHDHVVLPADDHGHDVDLPALGMTEKATTTGSNVPEYYALLKIMRIRRG